MTDIDIEMGQEIYELIPIMDTNTNTNTYTYTDTNKMFNYTTIFKLVYLLLFHMPFIICDIYFINNNCRYTPKIIIDTKVYFIIDALIEIMILIFMVTLIILRTPINLRNNFHKYSITIYYILAFYWNIMGIFILFDLPNCLCENKLHNYLFAKIIISSTIFISFILFILTLLFKFMNIILNTNTRNHLIKFIELFI